MLSAISQAQLLRSPHPQSPERDTLGSHQVPPLPPHLTSRPLTFPAPPPRSPWHCGVCSCSCVPCSPARCPAPSWAALAPPALGAASSVLLLLHTHTCAHTHTRTCITHVHTGMHASALCITASQVCGSGEGRAGLRNRPVSFTQQAPPPTRDLVTTDEAWKALQDQDAGSSPAQTRHSCPSGALHPIPSPSPTFAFL